MRRLPTARLRRPSGNGARRRDRFDLAGAHQRAVAHADGFTDKKTRKEKTSEKALIPLPPTGSASVFCANPDAMKAILQPRPAVGLRRGAAIARHASLCRKMSAPCTASYRALQRGAKLEGPARLGGKFGNRGMWRFSKSTPVPTLRTTAAVARSVPDSTTQAGRGL